MTPTEPYAGPFGTGPGVLDPSPGATLCFNTGYMLRGVEYCLGVAAQQGARSASAPYRLTIADATPPQFTIT